MTQVLGIVKEGKLIPENLWIKYVTSLQNDFDSLETNNERAKRELAEAIIQAIKKRTASCLRVHEMNASELRASKRARSLAGRAFSHATQAREQLPKFGVLFSGGVDSSLIAFVSKQLKSNFTCYTVGIANSNDIIWAQKVANEYKFNFKYKILSLDEFKIVVKNVVKLLNDADFVKVSVGSVLYAAGKLALANGDKNLFVGLGSEELFAGYQRHEDAFQGSNFEALHKECWNGLKNMWSRDLVRDFTIAKALRLNLMTPFLDKDLIKTAMNIHPMLKLDKNHKKIILRESAEFIGLKKEFAWRKKQAAQYGSNFVNGIDKLARGNGFKFKKEYLQSLL